MRFFASLILVFCSVTVVATAQSTVKYADFKKVKNDFIENLWLHNPNWAVSAGNYAFAGKIKINDEATRNKDAEFVKSTRQQLALVEYTKLTSDEKTDFQIIKNFLQAEDFYRDTLQSWKWNPSEYNVGDVVNSTLIEKYKPLSERVLLLNDVMKYIPAYYTSAQKNIENPTKEHTDLAIQQNEGLYNFFQQDILDSLRFVEKKLTEKQINEIKNNAQTALSSIQSYVSYLKTLKPTKSFRIGKELFAKKFNYEIVNGNSAYETYANALVRRQYLHKQMITLSKELWKKYFGETQAPSNDLELVKLVINKISEKHCKPEAFVSTIRQQIPELTTFVKEKNLLYLDEKKPLVVRETPEYMRGVAGASISAPGPYDANGNTYYNVTPLDGYTDEASKESYLREYNHYILQILNIHEAIPGHYAQLVYSNKAPSLVKSILGNGAMVEGWAVYTELMMLENGYGNNEPEMWLMYYKWNLRSVCNTILDYSVHSLNISEQDAMKLLTEDAFQQQAEAKGKWRRATLSSVQLCSYFGGFDKIVKLRDEIKKLDGNNFSLKTFNEEFLSYGSAPIKNIRDLMLEKRSKQIKINDRVSGETPTINKKNMRTIDIKNIKTYKINPKNSDLNIKKKEE